jgi:tetratricopeptide (TPR) repeat protein
VARVGARRASAGEAAAALVHCLVLGLSAVQAGEKARTEPSKFLAPAELAESADKSKVSYGTTIVKSGAELPAFTHPTSFSLSAIAQKALEDAEVHFKANEYHEALAIYREALARDPGCYVLHMNAGDCYLLSGNSLAALESHDRTIELNPDDFHGHWFRASALVELGRREEARRSYARAVAMSPRKPTLLQAINKRADRLGFQARESLRHPLADARLEGDVYRVHSVDSTHWWIYGLKELTGSTNHIWTTTEELECTANLLARYGTDREIGKEPAELELDVLLEVLDARSEGAFVNYEFGSRVAGDYSILLDPDLLDRVVEFVDRFVFHTPWPERAHERIAASARSPTRGRSRPAFARGYSRPAKLAAGLRRESWRDGSRGVGWSG